MMFSTCCWANLTGSVLVGALVDVLFLGAIELLELVVVGPGELELEPLLVVPPPELPPVVPPPLVELLLVIVTVLLIEV